MSVIIVEDKGQQAGKHENKHRWFDCHDVELLQAPLPVGDYILYTEMVEDVIQRKAKRGVDLKKLDFLGSYKVCVDTKRDMTEIEGNICGKQHDRFKDECVLAQNNGIQLYVLVENQDGISCLDDVPGWKNPRIERYEMIVSKHKEGKWKRVPEPKAPPTAGKTLAKCMKTMQDRYGVKFLFCHPDEAGERILQLLTTQEE